MFHNRRSLAAVRRPFVAAAGGSTVLVDVIHAENISTPLLTSLPVSYQVSGFNVGSGPNGILNRAIVVAAVFNNVGTGIVSGVSSFGFGGKTLPLVLSTPGSVSPLYLFGVVAPNTGDNQVITLSWTGNSNGMTLYFLSVVNADQTGSTTTFKNAANAPGSSALASNTISTISGEIVFGAFCTAAAFSTAVHNNIGSNNGGAWSCAAGEYTTATTGSTSIGYNCTSAAWDASAVAIKGV